MLHLISLIWMPTESTCSNKQQVFQEIKLCGEKWSQMEGADKKKVKI